MLKQFGPEIWTADGPEVVGAMGFHFPTRMTVIRLTDRDLFIWSPTALTDELRASVDALGNVRHVIGPNSLHHTFLADWKRTYPASQIHAAPGLRETRKDIAFDSDLGDTPHPAWAAHIDQVVVHGNRITTEVAFFHRESRTVLFTDLIQQFPRGWFKGWRALVASLDLMTEPEPSVPRKFRAAFSDRRAARASLERVLTWPSENVLMAHGTPVIGNGQTFLARAFHWLKP